MASGETTFVACGDINVQYREDPARVFDLVKDDLAAADLRLGNMEMCLSGADDVIAAKLGWTQSSPDVVDALRHARFDAVTTANNVTFPGGSILRSLRVLDDNGIGHTGSGPTLHDSRRPTILEHEGTRIGMLGYTCIFYPLDHAATDDAPGVAALKCHTAYEPHRRSNELPGAPPTVRSWPDPDSLAAVREDIDRVRDDVDVLITYFHMGVSSQEELTEYQRLVGRAMVDHGVDLVLGASAHKPQAVEVYKGKVIFYGLGNFAFDWPKVRHRRHGLLAECRVVDGLIDRVAFRPVTRQDDELNQPVILRTDASEGRLITDRVAELSAGLGTTFVGEDDGRMVVWNR